MLVLLILSIVYLIGPRISTAVTMETPIAASDVPIGELDEFLSKTEGRFAKDLVKDTAKRIFWHDDKPGTRTPVAVVFLHGFSGSHPTMEPLPQEVAHTLEANLFCTRYAGHGRKDAQGFGGPLAEAELQEWVDDTREALTIGRTLGERVVVIANSTSAPLVSWLAGKGESPDVLVLLSPNFGLNNSASELVMGPWGEQILWLIEGETHSATAVAGDEHRRIATTEYPSKALITLMAAIKLGRESRFERIEIPVLCLYSKRDEVVSTDWISDSFERFNSPHKQLREVTTCTHSDQHVLAGNLMSPPSTADVRDMIIGFVEKNESAKEVAARPSP